MMETMADHLRLLPLEGAYNFRDLGGYPTADGRTTTWGRVYRSDTLHELSEKDLALLRDLGLRTVLDLRAPAEVERQGRGVLGFEPIRYFNVSVLQAEGGEQQAAPTPRGGDTAKRYLSYLETGRSALVDAFLTMAESDSYPLVFHCYAGKDRTGVLAALVLGSIGVERTAIVDDYVLTATRMDLIMGRLRRDPLYADRIDGLPASVFSVEASTMERFLEGLDDRYGGARSWALEAGVGEEHLYAMGDILVDG
jgi:protein-tyrosine phosphatase